MNEQAIKEAFNAIIEEAETLLVMDLPESVSAKIELIESIARYQYDARKELEILEGHGTRKE